MTQIQPFVLPETSQQVRTVVIGDEPWFVAVDVCAVLEIGNPSQAVSNLDDDEKQQVSPNLISNEGGRTPWIVSEPGLYSLILRSRKPQAKAFRRWVTHEVLPSIHRTGSYSVDAPAVGAGLSVTVQALAELAYNEHVIPFAGKALAYRRWRKPRKGMDAFVQLTINLNLPGIEGSAEGVRALPGRDVTR